MILVQEQVKFIGAGVGLSQMNEALHSAMQFYTQGAIFIASVSSIIQCTHIYATFGASLGEQVFNLTHPNPLGQMVYFQAVSEQGN